MTLDNLQQHLRSRTHLGTPIACPFCVRKFVTAAGLAHHLERSACPAVPYLGHREVFEAVKSADPYGYLTKVLVKYESSLRRRRFHASDDTWDGEAWRCYACFHKRRERRRFGSREALAQHLASAARKCVK